MGGRYYKATLGMVIIFTALTLSGGTPKNVRQKSGHRSRRSGSDWDFLDDVFCGIPTSPSNGDVTYGNMRFDDTATYSCNGGFDLVGCPTRICLSNSSWSGAVPACVEEYVPPECPDLTAPPDGTVDVPSPRAIGSKATYACTYVQVSGDLERFCVGTDVGEWTGTQPTCASVFADGTVIVWRKPMSRHHTTVPTIKGIAQDCGDVYEFISTTTGVFTVYPCGDITCPVSLYCDMSDGGGWTVFQRRVDGSTDFNRNWTDYKTGFGNPDGNLWLGLEELYQIVSSGGSYELRIDLEKFDGDQAYAEYSSFWIGPESEQYRLFVSGFNPASTAGDSLTGNSGSLNHNAQYFTTPDSDNDNKSGENCAIKHKGSWWFNNCLASNLNGEYLNGQHNSWANGIIWSSWTGYKYSPKTTVMKIRKI